MKIDPTRPQPFPGRCGGHGSGDTRKASPTGKSCCAGEPGSEIEQMLRSGIDKMKQANRLRRGRCSRRASCAVGPARRPRSGRLGLARSGLHRSMPRCNDCLKAVRRKILVVGDGGYPTVDFSPPNALFAATASRLPAQGLAGLERPCRGSARPRSAISARPSWRRGPRLRRFLRGPGDRFAPRLGGSPLPER